MLVNNYDFYKYMYDNDTVLENDILNVNNDPCAILDLMMKMTLYVYIMHHEPIKR